MQIEFKRGLYAERGAEEFWYCDQNGDMTFFDAKGRIPRSLRCPQFPANVDR